MKRAKRPPLRGPLSLLAAAIAALGMLGCDDRVEGPTPSVGETITPGVACNGGSAENAGVQTTITITSPDGTFSPLPVGALDQPSIDLPRVYLVQGGQRTEIREVRFVDASTLRGVISAELGLAAGTYQVEVENPNGYRSAAMGALRIVDPPVVTGVEAPTQLTQDGAARICTGIDNTLTVTGTGFRPEDPAPRVEVLACADPADPASCTEAVASLTDVSVTSETSLTGVLPGGASGLSPGTYAVRVTNPEEPPCAGTFTTAIVVVPPPSITGIDPAQLCGPDPSVNTTVTITGSDYTDPMVATIGGAAIADLTLQSDTTLTGTAPNTLEPGTHDVTVTSPEGCSDTLEGGITVVPVPTITAVEPPLICGAGTITVTGTGYLDPMTGTLGGEPLADVTVQSDTTLTATTPGSLAPGLYDLTVTLAEGCSATLASAVTIAPPAAVLSAIIPSQGWTGIDTPVQIYGSGFNPGDALVLAGAAQGGGDLALTFVTVDTSGTRVDALVPQGGVPGGPYDLVLQAADGCLVALPAAFTILADASLTVSQVIPSFGWYNTRTPVSIFGADFQSTPKAYLVVPTMSPSLQPLRSTAFVSPTSLTSAVPSGLDVGGPYDLVVINPDGGGGLLPAAFRVTNLPPPTVENVTPGAGNIQDPTPVTITGCNLRATAMVDVVDAAGNATAATVTGQPVCGGAPVCPDNTGVCTMTATIPSNALPVGAYVVRVTNTDEMTWGDWSVFVVTEPSAKLDQWVAASATLVTGRRGHAGLSGRINNASRFLYVIGGDTGAGGMTLDSVEVIPVDIFGGAGAPFEQRYKLSTPRTGLAAVQRGRYVYAIGGTSDGALPLGTIERAKILDDSDVPEVQDPTIGAGTLAAGTWYYMVSAVKDAADPDNPSGETLPSDELVVSLGIPGGVTLAWNAVPGAAAYRVYRTEMANGVSQSEVLLAEINATTYTDDGAATVDPTQTFLRRGSTGVWVTQADTLVRARFAHEAAIAHDPNGSAFVYAVGGTGSCTGAGAAGPMSCYEFAPLSADGATLGAWTAGAGALSTPRTSFGLAAGENANASQIPAGTAYLFATGGVGAANSGEALLVQAGGELGAPAVLGPPTPQSSPPPSRNGHALQLVNNAMFLNGGVSGNLASGLPLASTFFSVQFTNVPHRSSFSDTSVPMAMPRYEHALVLESGFFYAIGGSTDGALSNVTNTIEATIY